MSEVKHTPGPWMVWRNYDPEGFISDIGIDTADRSVGIAEILVENITHDSIEEFNIQAEADAAMMAAGPELYRVLEEMMLFWDNRAPVHPGALIVADAREVMAKARINLVGKGS